MWARPVREEPCFELICSDAKLSAACLTVPLTAIDQAIAPISQPRTSTEVESGFKAGGATVAFSVKSGPENHVAGGNASRSSIVFSSSGY